MRWWQIRKRDADLERELRSDLELEEEEQQERGLSPENARYAARRALGNTTLIRERTHEAWGWAPFERLSQDVRFAFRQFSKSPRFAFVCVITLALGIAAQTTIYSVVHAVLIDPYPYRGAMRMVHLHLYDKDPAPYDLALDGPQFAEFAKSPVLDGAVAEDVYTMALTGADLPEQLQVGRISPNAFEYFGVPVLLGRVFGPSDRDKVAVLSYSFWRSHFAGRANVIGQSVQLNKQDYEIIGVMPQRFAWTGSDLYVPLAYSSDPRRPANVYARIRSGVSDRLAEQALQPMLDVFTQETPANFPQKSKLHLVHINEIAIGRFKGFLVVLFLSVSLLLVLACVNVAILMLARGEARQVEIAMRKALGAGRRIVMQLLIEAVLLSASGGLLGVLGTLAGIRLVQDLIQPLPSLFPPEAQITLNVPVLIFSVGVSVLTGIVCGLWPALRLSSAELRQTFDGGGHKLSGRRGTRNAHTVLLAAEVSLTIVLLACSGATMRKLSQLVNADLGYEPQNLSSVNLVLREGSHDRWADRVHYFEEIRESIASVPGVLSAAIGSLPPNLIDSTPVAVPAQKATSGQVIAQQVSPDYFSTLRIPLHLGRVWTASETAHAAGLAVINEAMRRRYWPNSNPIGQTIVLNNGVANGNVWRVVAPGDNQHFLVIGVAGDAPNRGLGEEVSPGVYVPFTMMPFDGFNVVVRAHGDPVSLLQAIKEHVDRVDAGQSVGSLTRATDLLEEDSLGRERFVSRLFSGFAFLGLVFAASGLYSIQSYLVAQRKQELGLRIALGAQRAHIVREVTRACALSVLAGVGIGIVLNLALSRVFAHWTNGNARDPEMLLAIVALLLFAAALACVRPSLAATSIAPVDALRAE